MKATSSQTANPPSDRSPRLTCIASHTLLPELLPVDAIVLDLGANVGAFSVQMVRDYGCRSIAVEASESYFGRLPQDPRIRTFNYAVAGESGHVELFVPKEGDDFPTMHKLGACDYPDKVRVPARSLEAFCAEAGVDRIDLLKMDIEGAELAVFASCSDNFLGQIGQVTVEFHEWAGVGTPADVKRIIARMRRLGFYVFSIGRTVYGDVLFVNRKLWNPIGFAKVWVGLWVPRAFRSALRRLFRGTKRASGTMSVAPAP